jgi:NTP pyrophosphatase (non-canonical NTP hydrolase)
MKQNVITAEEYQNLAMRTNDNKSGLRLVNRLEGNQLVSMGSVLNACLGLSGEVGELNDLVKKYVFHNKPMDEVHLKREIGDICWYIALMCDACGYDLGDIMQMNIDKLKARYPEGFDTDKANNRKETDL